MTKKMTGRTIQNRGHLDFIVDSLVGSMASDKKFMTEIGKAADFYDQYKIIAAYLKQDSFYEKIPWGEWRELMITDMIFSALSGRTGIDLKPVPCISFSQNYMERAVAIINGADKTPPFATCCSTGEECSFYGIDNGRVVCRATMKLSSN